MPMENAHALLSEADRILKPGGVLSGFEGMFYTITNSPNTYTVAELLQLRNLISGYKCIMIFDVSVPYLEEDIMREIMIQTQTWGYHWNNTGPHGPEPYNEEYLVKFSKNFNHNEFIK